MILIRAVQETYNIGWEVHGKKYNVRKNTKVKSNKTATKTIEIIEEWKAT